MEDLEDFMDFVDILNEIDEAAPLRLPKRYLRDNQNPFEKYREKEFVKRFRFRKENVLNLLLPLVVRSLERESNRGLPISPVIQLLTALRFYATGNFQIVCGDLKEISQPTVSLIIKNVSKSLAEKMRQFVKFPDTHNEQQRNIRNFFEIAHFPNVVACVDGTHIPIKNPGGDIGEIFRNRKRFFSLNVQAACDADMKIVDLDVRYPGSAHDNTIFDRSGLRVRFETRQIRGFLLGDNGYSCRHYLLTPVINPVSRQEQNYNRAHIKTRNIIERVFGGWKRRFPCLKRNLLNKLETSLSIVCATALLYNISKISNEEEVVEDQEVAVDVDPENAIDNAIGLAFRRTFIDTHF